MHKNDIYCTYTYIFFSIYCIFIPLRSIYRHFRKQKNSSFLYLITEYCILLILFFNVLQENSISLAQIKLFPLNTPKDISLFFICILSLIGVEYFFLLLIRNTAFSITKLSNRREVIYAKGIVFSKSRVINKLLIIIFCVFSSTWEETFFRGFLFYVFTQFKMNTVQVVFLSSCIFALYHFANGKWQMVYSFFFGILFSIFFIISGSLLVAIACHIAGNIFVLLVAIPILLRRSKEIIFF